MTQHETHLVIDGPVGAGKSTLMSILANHGFTAFPEPVVENPLLEQFYRDRARYSFSLQILLLNKRFEHIRKARHVAKSVMDRSIYCDEIFAKMLFENGEMTKEEFQIYQELRANMLEHCKPPTLMIYLEISTDTAVQRIHKRKRTYELETERKYWEDLNHAYREYFKTYSHSPLLTIQVDDMDFENNPSDRERVLSIIDDKLREIRASNGCLSEGVRM
jgi:deoxyadenosine/deoxycytidine kinase